MVGAAPGPVRGAVPVARGLLLDGLRAGQRGMPAGRLEPQRVGMTGHSFGGWTTLVPTTRDSRIVAALPLAPGGGRTATTPRRTPALPRSPTIWGIMP